MTILNHGAGYRPQAIGYRENLKSTLDAMNSKDERLERNKRYTGEKRNWFAVTCGL
jgi:hypothetical protein